MNFQMPMSLLPAPETAVYGCNPAGYQPPPAEFTVSAPFSGATGLVTRGVGGGSALRSPLDAYAVLGAYVSSNRCSASDQEYGFYQNLTKPGEWDFYYSQFTNTSSQITSPLTEITNLSGTPGEDNYFDMYIIPASEAKRLDPSGSNAGYYFRIQILGPDYALRTCSINGSRIRPCTADVEIDQSFWPVSSMVNGPSYVVEFTQVSYYANLNYQQPGTWEVDGVWLGFGTN